MKIQQTVDCGGRARIAAFLIVALFSIGSATAGELPEGAQQVDLPLVSGAKVFRPDRTLLVQFEAGSTAREIQLPRLAAPLRDLSWGEPAGQDAFKVQVEQDRWIIRWEAQPATSACLRIEFDAPPVLTGDLQPIAAAGDGSFWLPAHLAVTAGEKIRYEPQTYKNTVGYWTGRQDQATWQLHCREPGRFNVGLLQGCGRGQGGSLARIEVQLADSAEPPPAAQVVQLEVLETGHFQNFQWRQVGSVTLAAPGIYTLKILPEKIQKAALMDVRAIHLVRLPE